MKYRVLLFLWFFATTVSAQTISEYYATAFGKQGAELKQELNLIISNHREYGYTSSSTDVWDILKETDKDPENPDNVILIYSNVSVNAAQEYNNGSGWTREHVWAKSRGDFGTDRGAGTDVHHLRPESASINSSRSNRSFKNCQSCNYLDYQGSVAGANSTTEFTYEPNDNVKGDVARMIFYMAVRYEGNDGELDLEVVDSILSSTDKSPLHGKLSDLLAWNLLDTVSDFERNRNEIIFNDYQENRNPFIDFPELAEYIFGSKTGETWTHPLAISSEQLVYVRIHSIPSQNSIIINNASKWNMEVFNTLGQKLYEHTISSNHESIELPFTGILVIKLSSEGRIYSEKIIL